MLSLTQKDEDPALYNKIDNTQLQIQETGLYEISCSLILNSDSLEQYIEIRLILNGTLTDDKFYGSSPEYSRNDGDFYVYFEQTLLVNAGDILG